MDLQSILSSEISETAEEVLIATELLNSQIIYYHPSLPAPQLFFFNNFTTVNSTRKIKVCWIIQTLIFPSDGLSLSQDRNLLNLCLLGWNSHVKIIWTIRTVCVATVKTRTPGAVKVWTWNCEIWNANDYSNDQCINLHAESIRERAS